MYIAKDIDDFRKDNRMLLRVYKCNQWKTRIFFCSVQSYEKYPTGIVNERRNGKTIQKTTAYWLCSGSGRPWSD